ncbi:hypothetical protein V8B55DRAFT_1361249 [Mucor lusitanicus]|uniref:Uncharacterized protein n=2 Tax=Mucor circinelloides f. lusitanicus TaxID=29924 RepID=A0A162QL39_MUCCL|nr:hypothetical protein MUCCIDRAFT_162501 [Mucor lusitanicus CBS 277.49]
MPPKKTNAVNSVVSDLIRAAAGAGARNVSDEDVDKYVADLILKEAEEKRKKYNQVGVKAYQPDTPPINKPKPNTRFLLNMVKATDSHNQAVIRANEENVAKLRQERLERERKQREESRRKDDERRRSRHHRHHREDRHHDSKSRSATRESPSPERPHSSRHKRHRSRSRSPSKKDSKRHKHDQEKEKPLQFKGRGKVKINSSMDKYFSKGYDPLLDVASDKEDDYVFALNQDKDKKKRKSKKKKKKSKKSSDTDSDSSVDIGPPPPAVRAWDVGKASSS